MENDVDSDCASFRMSHSIKDNGKVIAITDEDEWIVPMGAGTMENGSRDCSMAWAWKSCRMVPRGIKENGIRGIQSTKLYL